MTKVVCTVFIILSFASCKQFEKPFANHTHDGTYVGVMPMFGITVCYVVDGTEVTIHQANTANTVPLEHHDDYVKVSSTGTIFQAEFDQETKRKVLAARATYERISIDFLLFQVSERNDLPENEVANYMADLMK